MLPVDPRRRAMDRHLGVDPLGDARVRVADGQPLPGQVAPLARAAGGAQCVAQGGLGRVRVELPAQVLRPPLQLADPLMELRGGGEAGVTRERRGAEQPLMGGVVGV